MQTEAALTQAQVNLGYTDIRAPIDGRIGRTAFTPAISSTRRAACSTTIVSQDPIYVLFPVSVRELEDDPRGAPARKAAASTKIEILVRLRQRPGLSASGHLELHRSAGRPADRHG